MDEEQKEGDRAAAHQKNGDDRRDVKRESKWVESDPLWLDAHENSPALSSDLSEAEYEKSESEENRDCNEEERVGDWENAADAKKEHRATEASGSCEKASAHRRQIVVCLGHATQIVVAYHDPPNM